MKARGVPYAGAGDVARPGMAVDEVNHVKYGRRWTTRFACEGDRAQRMSDETVTARAEFYARASEEDAGSPG